MFASYSSLLVPLAHFMNIFLLSLYNPFASYVCSVPVSSTPSASSKVPQYSIKPHEHDPLIPPHTAVLPPPSSTSHLIHHYRNSNLSPPFRTFTKVIFTLAFPSRILHICKFHIQCITVLYQIYGSIVQSLCLILFYLALHTFHSNISFHHFIIIQPWKRWWSYGPRFWGSRVRSSHRTPLIF